MHRSLYNNTLIRTALIAAVIAAISAFFVSDATAYLSLEAIKAQRATLLHYYDTQPALTIAAFAGIFISITALSLPFATILTLVAGALFGFWGGLIIASYASAIGATLAFLMARFLARDMVQARYGTQLQRINDGLQKDGALYLFMMRLTPLFPFFMINMVMGVLPMRPALFYLITQLGMLPATAIYVYTGTELAQLNSLSDIASPSVIASLVGLGLCPLIAKKTITSIRG
jgi:uncharacterized membrane protein YdjX (TVP38/TMEM64 family)